ncbi:MAG: hypothetical protein O9256_00330 [Rhizobiaceae bacterium]|nr:hypothetical protein [Rhizobiaceae bacterium]
MKHRRGIDLVPEVSDAGQLIYTTLGMLPEFYVLGCRCRECGHQSMVDRWEIARRYGKGVYIGSLGSRLTCTKCGVRGKGEWLVGKLPRD